VWGSGEGAQRYRRGTGHGPASTALGSAHGGMVKLEDMRSSVVNTKEVRVGQGKFESVPSNAWS
jgi:hypothetical protein